MIIQNGNTIHLIGKNISYIMFAAESGDLLHFYFGKKIADCDYSQMTDEWALGGYANNEFPLDEYPQEYPAFGYTDLRSPAYEVINQYGNAISRLKLKEYKIHNGVTSNIEGMPSLFTGNSHSDTLEVILYDENINLEVHLFYTVFDEYNIIARNTVIINKTDSNIKLTRAYSSSIDLPINTYDMIHFAGNWANEREMHRTRLTNGIRAEAENGRESSHQMNPFVIIASPDADEIHGEAYGFSLIYSGNHSTVADVNPFGMLRVQQGINPHLFEKSLSPNESFCTPQSVICYSDNGFGAMSGEYHDLYKNNLMRSKWVHKDRPILINNWEATYFNFNEEKLISIAKKAYEAGIELFVLDDGWFGKRDSDNCSLGDWVVDEKKLPNGIKGLSEKINNIGLKFGLWFEPEMISPDSDLYRTHPDWAIQVKERTPIQSRNQLILDLTRNDVCNYVIKSVCDILENANIDYVKWDFNRPMTDMPRLGYNHEYVLGLYKVMDAITSAFPHILFEGCCGGGGRFDPGILAYMPQIWTSDNSDAVARLKIQYATSMCYPISSISNHVTAVPNHQCGRITSLKTRGDTAYVGTFGYELDITKATDAEFEEIKQQIIFDKKIRGFIREGDFYRLQNPYDSNFCGWEVVSKDKDRAILFTEKILVDVSCKNSAIKLQGLDPNKQYRETGSGKVYGGDMLMYKGININYVKEDFATQILEFKEI